MDVAHGEMVEKELDNLIRKRAALEDPEAKQALWLRSVERYHARERRQNRALWFAYFSRMADSHRALSEHYERRAEELCEEGAA